MRTEDGIRKGCVDDVFDTRRFERLHGVCLLRETLVRELVSRNQERPPGATDAAVSGIRAATRRAAHRISATPGCSSGVAMPRLELDRGSASFAAAAEKHLTS